MSKRQNNIIAHLESLIKCSACNSAGGYLGDGLGFCECDYCGGDGHRLYGMEGTHINELFDYEQLKEKKERKK